MIFRQTDGFSAAASDANLPLSVHPTSSAYPTFSISILAKTMRKVLTDYHDVILEKLGRDKIYAIESPSYEKIEQIYQAAGVVYEALPLSDDGIDSDALSATNADVLHTTPYRSVPSGVAASASKRHEYIRWANKADRFIIESDYGSEFSVFLQPMETLFVLADHDNVI